MLFYTVNFYFVIIDSGSWNKNKFIIVLYLNHFHLTKVKRIQAIILSKFNNFSYKIKTLQSDENRDYIIKISTKEVYKVKELTSGYIYFTLKYKL